ncbi:hypothetical protein ACFO0N_08745 [Halobium salinum]|uniref:Uncharacterized protein n=1 Tax=Halobium salinum TaxID=1364940 RepID=A0ABD5PBF8_9EURY|nr:hypothetical protein [Halobium salinum]
MPDTKNGRERKGLNKEAQLEHHLAEREVDTMGAEDDEPDLYEDVEGELLVEPVEGDD